MALDVYVMPLWRFKAGDFTSPIEDVLGMKPAIVAPGMVEEKPPWYLRLLAWIGVIEFTEDDEPTPEERRVAAQAEVAALKAALSAACGHPVEWRDEGGVYYNEQFYYPVHLQAFAKWYDHREAVPVFEEAPRLNYWDHEVMKLPNVDQPRFPLIVGHDLCCGYFIPAPFEGNHELEPFKSWGNREQFRSVVSTQAVAHELADLLAWAATVPDGVGPQGDNPVKSACWYAEELQMICALSLEHGVPVIFYG